MNCLRNANENDEIDQNDEIMALKSIYDRSFHCDTEKRPFEGRLHIDVDFHDISPLTVSCGIVNADNLIALNHLSPICLTFSLPPDYPSNSPPVYNLSCLWLTSEQIKLLMKELDALWQANCNGVVLFNWLTVLQTETLNILTIKFPLLLTQDKILKLTEYDLKKSEREFCTSIHECVICFCEKSGQLCVKFSECGHIFCKECLTNFLNVHIKDGNVKSLKCLAEKCSSEIDHSIVKALVDPETFERYDRLLLQGTLDSMTDVAYCPRPWCACAVIVDKQLGMGSCQACQYTFCIYCKMTYHGVEKCKLKSKELRKLAEAYSTASKGEQAELERIYGKKMIIDIMDGLETEKWLESNSKRCPKCYANIEKNDGCNKMICTKCKIPFCWLCLQQLTAPNPYSHYANKESACYNKLFPFEERAENDEDDLLFGNSDEEFD